MGRRHSTSGQATAAASTAQGKLDRHLRELGMASLDEYRAWTREHGFSDSPGKDWHDRRAELRCRERELAERDFDADLQQHLRSLGLETAEEYATWCETHGFGPGLRKSKELRAQELRIAHRERAEAVLRGPRRRWRKPEAVIEEFCRGEVDPAGIRSPNLWTVGQALQRAEGPVRKALRRLLVHAMRESRLIDDSPVIAQFGRQQGNSFVEGLLALARYHDQWLRRPEDWQPDSRNRSRQFGSLARHLLARYPAPSFLDSAWFQPDPGRAAVQQGWFLHVAAGQNIRTAGVPTLLSRKAAHYFLEAPEDFTIEGAIRWGQIHALDPENPGAEYLTRAIAATRLGELTDDEEFWFSVLHFFVNNPMLDRHWIGPVIDYIQHRKFEPLDGPGTDPPDAAFTMKGRTGPAMLRLVEEWHRALAKENPRGPVSWAHSGIGSFSAEETDETERAGLRWTVVELLSAAELREEGKAMRHCVSSYAASCARGHTSIWSIRLEDPQNEMMRRVMTVEVLNTRRFIAQARGRCNRLPGERRSSLRLDRAPAILKQWARQERLVLPGYI